MISIKPLLLIVAIACLLINCGRTNSGSHVTSEKSQKSDFEAPEYLYQSKFLELATANPVVRTYSNLSWPFKPLSIGHNISSYQNYGSDPYFHHGIDIRGSAGTEVHAAAGGKVVNIENYVSGNPLYWEVAILDDQGFLWQYHHIDYYTIPSEVKAAFKSGTKITEGTIIGKIVEWPLESFGERFDHIHLNVLAEGGVFVNPLSLLEPINDIASPTIAKVGILKNELIQSGSSVSGNYTLYTEVKDLILHEKYFVPPYSISYSVDDEKPVVVWKFDQLPGGDSTSKFVHQFFMSNYTCGDYECRRFVIDLGFRKSGRQYFTKKQGKHSAVIDVTDFSGNNARKSFSWSVY